MPRNEIQRRLRRAKDSERAMAKWQQEHDGPDPKMRPGTLLVTSTGRVGHITGLQFDTLSRTYAGENKQERIPVKLYRYWLKIVGKAWENGKEPLLRLDLNQEQATKVQGRPLPPLHIITEDRHAELLRCERELIRLQTEKPPCPKCSGTGTLHKNCTLR